VRGEGDLVWVRASRASEFEVRKSLVVLTGSLLNVEAAREAPPPSSAMTATLHQATTCLQGPLLRVRASKENKGLATLQCRPDECLFMPAAPAGSRVLLRLEGPEVEENALRARVIWDADGAHNAFGIFDALIEFQPIEEGKNPQTKDLDSWKSWS